MKQNPVATGPFVIHIGWPNNSGEIEIKTTDKMESGKTRSINNPTTFNPWRRAFPALLVLACMAQTAAGKDPLILSSFEKADSAQGWTSVNDGVMGGISKGGFKRTEEKTLLFSGELSLENNGGFASIRTKPRTLSLTGAKGIVVKARGDGRTYWFELRTARQFGASSYRAYLKTEKNKFIESFIPLSEFKLQAFGRQLPSGTINPYAVQSFGFTLADKKEGPFKLEIDYVKAVFDDAKPSSTVPGGTIADIATSAGTFKTLLAAADAADLTGALTGDGPLTVFAPTDEAFSRLPAGTVETLLKPVNTQKLADILKYHVIPGTITISKALQDGEFTSLQGEKLLVAFKDGSVRVGRATVTQTPIEASNGMIFVIDQVLLPPEPTSKAMNSTKLIELALDRGVPLFNDGSPEACAAVYEVTCEALRMMPDVSKESRKDLDQALLRIKLAGSDREKAWILRFALDSIISRTMKEEKQ